jgi:hypothetical protein
MSAHAPFGGKSSAGGMFGLSVRRSTSLLLAIVAIVLLGAGSFSPIAPASPGSPIEEVWSFNGGEVAIQPQAAGVFVGTVVAPTSFAQCTHPVGEQMWTDIRPQPDGSYWGLHQWYFETAECLHNPTLGPTAWRVLEAASGVHYLLVCFSSPGGPQPTIAANGAVANVTFGCRESMRIAPLPVQAAVASSAGVQSFRQAVSLPSTRACVSRRDFQIHLQDPNYDPLKEVVVTIGGRRVAVVKRGKVLAATIDLKGLPRGTFTLKIRATTVLGHHLYGSRTYHTCVKKAAKSSKPKPLHQRRRR